MEIKPYFFLILLLLTLIPNVAKANPDTYTLEVSTDKPVYYEKGETMQINAFSNASIQVSLKVFWNWRTLQDNELIYQNTKTANATWSLPTDNQKVGFYKIVVNSSELTVTTWRTLISFSDYTSETLPFSHIWKGINYSLIGRNFRAEKQDDFIEIQYPKIPFEHTTDLFRNNMSFLVRLSGVGWKVDLCYMTVHSGLKWIVNGTLNNPQTFEFKCSHNLLTQWVKRLDSLRSSGNLVFDWGDLRKAGKAFIWNQTTKTLIVEIPESFSLDPYIFEDGFESGDFSAWDGTSGTPTVESDNPHCETYQEETIGDNSGGSEYCYEALSLSGVNPVYLRYYAYLEDIGDSDYNAKWGCGFYYYSSCYASARIIDGGLYLVYYDGSEQTDDTGFDLSEDTWYCIEIRLVHSSSDSGEVEIYVNGDSKLSKTSLNIGSYPTQIRCGHISDYLGAVSHFDCIIVDDEAIGCEVEGQELSFNLFENILFYGSSQMLKELSFSRYENILFYSSNEMGRELGFLFSETVKFWSSTITVFEGIALDLTFILFETVSFIASTVVDLEVVLVVTELDAGSLAGLALIVAVIALSLVFVYRKNG